MANYITDRQQAVLDFVRGYVAQHGAGPTIREVAGFMQVTPHAALDCLNALVRKRALHHRHGRVSRPYLPISPPSRDEKVLAERKRVLDLARTMLLHDNQREVSWHEVADFIEKANKG